ncbi:alpha/beta fold hydrolase, partial [Streptomyces sp. NRRL S-813]|uniref:thioesterase domain-containing protein n=1 Tax=Streptomyces sp. NRRL S-813 TaxID=1463919 RepID=UPI0004C16ACE
LLAVQLVERLREHDLDCDVRTVFTTPTIAGLAALMAWAADSADVAESPGTAESAGIVESMNAVKPAVSGNGTVDRVGDRAIALRAAGTAAPLFLMHDGFGLLSYAKALLPYLDHDIPVFGLPADPRGPQELWTVEGMASRMLRLIRKIQPSGPYRLAGYAFGGTLAYETAAQLLGQDEQVEMVGLFDARCEHNAAGVNEQNGEQEILRGLTGESEARTTHEAIRVAQAAAANIACDQYRIPSLPLPVHFFLPEQSALPDAWVDVVSHAHLRTVFVPGTNLSLLEAPQLESIGRALSTALGGPIGSHEPTGSHAATSAVSGAPATSAASVVLQQGHPDHAPLFCVPGAGAGVAAFTDLCDALGAYQPVYGLQYRGLDGIEVPHTSLAAGADWFVQAVDEVYPAGPVHLLGHSFGGWTVFEMARRMTKAGRTVTSLTIVDSAVPDTPNAPLRQYTHLEILLEWIRIFEKTLEHPLGIGVRELAEQSTKVAQLALIHQRLAHHDVVSPRTKPEHLRGPLNVFAAALRTRYTPESGYSGKIRLVLVKDTDVDEATNGAQAHGTIDGWRAWAPDLEAFDAPGTHMSTLKTPHVTTLADIVRKGFEAGR